MRSSTGWRRHRSCRAASQCVCKGKKPSLANFLCIADQCHIMVQYVADPRHCISRANMRLAGGWRFGWVAAYRGSGRHCQQHGPVQKCCLLATGALLYPALDSPQIKHILILGESEFWGKFHNEVGQCDLGFSLLDTFCLENKHYFLPILISFKTNPCALTPTHSFF